MRFRLFIVAGDIWKKTPPAITSPAYCLAPVMNSSARATSSRLPINSGIL